MRFLRKSFIVPIIFICFILIGCQEEKKIIESTSIEIGVAHIPENKDLNFRVSISNPKKTEYSNFKVRFIIKDKVISELVGLEVIELDETYKFIDTPLITGTSVKFKTVFNVDEIRKIIEKDEAVIVELFNNNQVIDREIISTFRENIKQLVKINPKKDIQIIESDSRNESILLNAVNQASKINYTPDNVPHPKYQFNIKDESYFLWIAENEGRIMNTKDTFTMYTLSNSSLSEIKDIIK